MSAIDRHIPIADQILQAAARDLVVKRLQKDIEACTCGSFIDGMGLGGWGRRCDGCQVGSARFCVGSGVRVRIRLAGGISRLRVLDARIGKSEEDDADGHE